MSQTPKPRGRPRKFEAAEALEKMRQTFAARGYADASLDDLTSASGLNRPSIYASFGDKETLYLQAFAAYASALEGRLKEALAGAGPIEERLGLFLQEQAQICAIGPVPEGCMLAGAAAAAHHQAIAEAARHWRERLLTRLALFFTACAAARQLPAEPAPTLRAQWTMAILDAIGQRARLGESSSSLRDFAADSVALICKV